jgi:hypothetical protein
VSTSGFGAFVAAPVPKGGCGSYSMMSSASSPAGRPKACSATSSAASMLPTPGPAVKRLPSTTTPQRPVTASDAPLCVFQCPGVSCAWNGNQQEQGGQRYARQITSIHSSVLDGRYPNEIILRQICRVSLLRTNAAPQHTGGASVLVEHLRREFLAHGLSIDDRIETVASLHEDNRELISNGTNRRNGD